MCLYVTALFFFHKPLQPPYDNHYHVLKRVDKHYTLDVAGCPEVVSLDCLKPAYLQSDLVNDVDTSTEATSTAHPTKSPVTITCFGQCVRMPVLRSLREEYCSEYATPKVMTPEVFLPWTASNWCRQNPS